MREPDFTLSAGPTTVSSRTLAAQGSPVTYHYDPVAEIGPTAKAHGALTLVDCVSSVAGMPFRTDEWQLDVCVAGPQKCIGGPPGMSLMTVSEAAWERIRANPSAPRASFL